VGVTTHCDILIVGGGCAGLTLAVELVQAGCDGRILIVEPRERYRRDRTWCHWKLLPHRFEDCVSHRWNSWKVRAGARETQQTTHRYVYEQIPADRFYTSALQRLACSPTVTLWQGTHAGRFRQRAGGFEVETSRGPVRAATVFDARPPALSADAPLLFQHFLGWHVRTGKPAFDPDCVTLMDFSLDRKADIQFFYVLPYSEREALIETTFLSPRPFADTSQYERSLQDYLARHSNAAVYEIRYRERGAIPMGMITRAAPTLPDNYYPIGTRGGMVRPSTGYAFGAIQRWCQNFVQVLLGLRPGGNYPRPYSPLSGWLDRIFLQHLLQAPTAAPDTFLRLFEKVEPEALVRFLSDRATPGDYRKVITAMPTWPFLKAAARAVTRRGVRGTGNPSEIDQDAARDKLTPPAKRAPGSSE